ncbi:uncharacterized protein isoform X2 [Rhodnius prolixus]|uniref:uncharacterized protein isoform X2 n=1 Tax=Rhodnius prolixus TaxID=13249 RepID=UPI003D187A1C
MFRKKRAANKTVASTSNNKIPEYRAGVLITNWFDRQSQYQLVQTKHPWISTYTEDYHNPYHELYEKDARAQDKINDIYNLKRADYFKNKAMEGFKIKMSLNADKPHNMKREEFMTNVETENAPNYFQKQKLYNLYHLGETLETKLKQRFVIESGQLGTGDKPTLHDQEFMDAWKDHPNAFFKDPKFKAHLLARLRGDYLFPPPLITETHEIYRDPDIKIFEERKVARNDIAKTLDRVCAKYKNFNTRDLPIIYSPDYPVGSLDKFLSRKPQDVLPRIPKKIKNVDCHLEG